VAAENGYKQQQGSVRLEYTSAVRIAEQRPARERCGRSEVQSDTQSYSAPQFASQLQRHAGTRREASDQRASLQETRCVSARHSLHVNGSTTDDSTTDDLLTMRMRDGRLFCLRAGKEPRPRCEIEGNSTHGSGPTTYSDEQQRKYQRHKASRSNGCGTGRSERSIGKRNLGQCERTATVRPRSLPVWAISS
jgi:hypothetical protein